MNRQYTKRREDSGFEYHTSTTCNTRALYVISEVWMRKLKDDIGASILVAYGAKYGSLV